MPLTPSHAVVALPFVRTPLPAAAVAVGAMTPDLPLFVRSTPLTYSFTHSWEAVPVTVVIALVFLLAWRCILRPATRELAPAALARRLPTGWDVGAASGARESFARRGTPPVSSAGVLGLVAALTIGVASHITWDLFTHEGRWGVILIPALAERWGPLFGYQWLQHLSSVVALAILGGWAVVRLRRAPVEASVRRVLPPWVRWAWWLSLPAVLAAAAGGGYLTRGPFTTQFTVAHLAYQVLLPACAVWGVLTVVLCLVVPVLRRRAARTGFRTRSA